MAFQNQIDFLTFDRLGSNRIPFKGCDELTTFEPYSEVSECDEWSCVKWMTIFVKCWQRLGGERWVLR